MAARMGVREFRENFTSIARDATEPIIVTNHDKVVGWFTPVKRDPKAVREALEKLDEIRARVEASGIDIDQRLKELGLDQESPHDEPDLRNARGKRSKPAKRR
jgi:antitoxin (DNA-binding transcriptional repressor) of toxin-antitoxin stability system